MKGCKVNGDRGYMLSEGPVMEVCACKEILGRKCGGCGDLFVYAYCRKWVWHMWLVVLCMGVEGCTVAMRDCAKCLGGVMDKVRCIFIHMVMLCLGVCGPVKSMWAGYLQSYLEKLLVQEIFGTEVIGSGG